MRMFRFVLAGLSLALLSAPAPAQYGLSQAGFEAYLPVLRAEALRAGVRPDTIERVFPTLTFSARTIQLDRSQPGGTPGGPRSNPNPPYAPYRARHITQALIDRGRARYAANYGQLQAISRRTGVPAAIMIAICVPPMPVISTVAMSMPVTSTQALTTRASTQALKTPARWTRVSSTLALNVFLTFTSVAWIAFQTPASRSAV